MLNEIVWFIGKKSDMWGKTTVQTQEDIFSDKLFF